MTKAAENLPVEKLAHSVSEAGKVSGLGRTLLYGEIASGALPSVKIGKRRLILAGDLKAFLASHRVAA